MPAQDDDYLYFRVKSGPILAFCEEWRRRAQAAGDAKRDLTEKYGAPGFVAMRSTDTLLGLHVFEPVPEGWQKAPLIGGLGEVLKPSDDQAGRAVQAEIDAIPAAPSASEIADFLGLPELAVCRKTDGRTVRMPVRNDLRPGTELGWATKEGPLMLRFPNPNAVIKKLKHNYPDAEIIAGRWTPPEGLKPISERTFAQNIKRAPYRDQDPARDDHQEPEYKWRAGNPSRRGLRV